MDARIAEIIQRPMTAGHLGEWIAARVFDIELEASAVAEGIDGVFRSGPLRGSTVNVKWYLTVRPWCVDAVFLFDARQLRAEQESRGVKRGIASSVRKSQWAAAEIYPTMANATLPVSAEQAALLALFRSDQLTATG